ncbi:MAG: helix-turn-helix domain-containing protein [Candidatus Paracaedibacteraceae bacterium]|nr:helix-turn-helix domain-containing protein [Candidatus Paracaedibacteraceae bacterium]
MKVLQGISRIPKIPGCVDVPEWLSIRMEITSEEKIVYAVMVDRCDKDDICRLSDLEISQAVGLPRENIIKLKRRLENVGLIAVKPDGVYFLEHEWISLDWIK